MTQSKCTLPYTFEYDGRGGDPGFVELQVHYFFAAGTPETGRFGAPENYDPGSGPETDYDYAEREVEVDGKKVWERLKPGEWLDEQCKRWLATRDESDLIEGLPSGGERDPDDARDAMIERRMMEREG